LEGESRLADGLGFACVEECPFGGGIDVFEEADDVVFAEDRADGVGAAPVVSRCSLVIALEIVVARGPRSPSSVAMMLALLASSEWARED
jgi:hypothetical protein